MLICYMIDWCVSMCASICSSYANLPRFTEIYWDLLREQYDNNMLCHVRSVREYFICPNRKYVLTGSNVCNSPWVKDIHSHTNITI